MEAGTNVERFGTIRMNEESRIEEFEEKPLQAKTNTISCGIYVVRRRLLIEMIESVLRKTAMICKRYSDPLQGSEENLRI